MQAKRTSIYKSLLCLYYRGALFMSIKKELNHSIFLNREYNIKHPELDHEFGFYKAIATGNKSMVEEYKYLFAKSNNFEENEQLQGLLSQDPVQSQKYHFAILAALVSRLCLEEGLDREVAYGMSDLYIQKVDTLTTVQQIFQLRDKMVNDYTNTMHEAKKRQAYSRQTAKAIDYISNNLNARITLTDIADALNMTSSYLSKLFSKETGQSISAYIKEEKLKAAANMLQYSDISITDISEYYHFSSQSHFTASFTELFGLTPKKYRDKYNKKIFM